MLIGYCIRRAGEPAPEPGLRGVGGGAVVLLEESSLGIWVSEGEPGRPTLDRVREHDAVVRAALRSATPLPLRYGTHLPDGASARNLLRERAAEFTRTLQRVEGRVEIGVRVVRREPPPAREAGPRPAPVRSGREFLEARRALLEHDAERRRLAEAIAAAVEPHFADVAPDAVRTTLPEPGVELTLAHLVHRGDLQRYRIRADRARAALPELELRLTGPWAPYSFV